MTDSPGASRTLVVATHNAGKVAEIAALLTDSGWDCRALPADTPEFPEDGETFAANAVGKALHYARLTGLTVLADDSGLVIDALGGEPGVRSARYIDPGLSQQERNRRVLDKLKHVPTEARGARFVCHLVLATPDGVAHETTGVCEGTITRRPHGEGGFGYDPVFRPAGMRETFAEISRQAKSARSHRGMAVATMIAFLQTWDPHVGGGGIF